MVETFIKQFTEDVNTHLNRGYSTEQLNKEGKDEFFGFNYAANCAINAIDSFISDSLDDTVIGRAKAEVAEEIKEQLYDFLICDACEVVYSVLDNLPEEE